MKNITKKLVASVLSLGILFTGMSSVQAEGTMPVEVAPGVTVEKPIIGLTWEVWDAEGPVNGGFTGWENSLLEPYYENYGDYIKYRMELRNGQPYTFAITIVEGDYQKFQGKDGFHNIVATLTAPTIEQAESMAAEIAQSIANDWNTENRFSGNYFKYVAPVEPVVEEVQEAPQTEQEETSKNNGKALGHDKNKAKGKAVGHTK